MLRKLFQWTILLKSVSLKFYDYYLYPWAKDKGSETLFTIIIVKVNFKLQFCMQTLLHFLKGKSGVFMDHCFI